MFAIWSAKGWGPVAFTTMLNPGPAPYIPPTLAHPDQLSYVNLERLTSIAGIKRSQISEILSQAHGPWLLHLGPRERVATLEAIAGFYGCFGYKRKEAYMLREILGCIMDLVVCGRGQPEDHHVLGSSSSVGLGIQGLASPHSTTPGGAGMVGVRENEIVDGNESVMKLVKYVCRTHGIDLEAVKVVDTESISQPSKDDEEGSCDDNQSNSGEGLQFGEPVGWPELQIGIVREAIAIAEALPGKFARTLCITS